MKGQGTSAGSSTCAESAHQQAARKVTRMSLIIVTTFTVARLPYQLDILVIHYGGQAHSENGIGPIVSRRG